MKKLIAGMGHAAGGAGLLVLWLLAAGAASAAPPETEADTDGTFNRLTAGSSGLPTLPTAEAPALRLLWFDPTRSLDPQVIQVAALEVRAIFRGLGVDVAFRMATPDTVYGAGDELEIPVILLGPDPAPSRRKDRVMGLVVRHQEPAHAVWAFLENIRATLGHDPQSRHPASARENGEVALALGRVIAHEVIHAIAPEEPHSREGLMNHALNRDFLLAKQARLDQRCARAFLANLASRSRSGPTLAAKGRPAPAASTREQTGS